MNTQRPRSEFTAVDQASMPQAYVDCMDFQHHAAFVQQYKARARSLLDLQPGLHVLDAGTGTGEDARAIATCVGPTGQVIGLDVSQTMLEVAKQRSQGLDLPLRFCQADLHHLPFVDATFDRCYADKTFQHLLSPRQALTELVRVLKPGGRLVVVDPDHDTHVLDSPYPEVTRRFLRFRSDGLRQPGIAHQQYELFQEAGLHAVTVEPLTWVTTDYETIRPMSSFIEGMRLAQDQGVVTAEEAERWITALEDAMRTGRFFHAVTYFLTAGSKPLE
jgi:ubiquinone/menaquinone biosynthesis C-methylase UbiE